MNEGNEYKHQANHLSLEPLKTNTEMKSYT